MFRYCASRIVSAINTNPVNVQDRQLIDSANEMRGKIAAVITFEVLFAQYAHLLLFSKLHDSSNVQNCANYNGNNVTMYLYITQVAFRLNASAIVLLENDLQL